MGKRESGEVSERVLGKKSPASYFELLLRVLLWNDIAVHLYRIPISTYSVRNHGKGFYVTYTAIYGEGSSYPLDKFYLAVKTSLPTSRTRTRRGPIQISFRSAGAIVGSVGSELRFGELSLLFV